MEKKYYVAPKASSITWAAESLMLVASPGVGGGYNPGSKILLKKMEVCTFGATRNLFGKSDNRNFSLQ